MTEFIVVIDELRLSRQASSIVKKFIKTNNKSPKKLSTNVCTLYPGPRFTIIWGQRLTNPCYISGYDTEESEIFDTFSLGKSCFKIHDFCLFL